MDVSAAVPGLGVEDTAHPRLSYYIGRFDTVHHLHVGTTYGVSYLLDRRNFDQQWSLQYAVYRVDKPWTNDFATKMEVLSTNLPWTTVSGDVIFPNDKEDTVPQLDLCS